MEAAENSSTYLLDYMVSHPTLQKPQNPNDQHQFLLHLKQGMHWGQYRPKPKSPSPPTIFSVDSKQKYFIKICHLISNMKQVMCILYNQRDATYTMFFIIIISTLHVSGGFYAHHQELIKLYVQPWVLSCFPALYCWCGWIETVPTHPHQR